MEMYFSGVPPRNPAMATIDQNYYRTIGSGLISFADLLMVNKHFQCEDVCKSQNPPECDRGGFPNPKNCQTCVCPGGYGGPLCKDQPTECNEALTKTATEEWEQIQVNAYNQVGDRYNYFKCVSWIKAPEGKKIQVEIADITSYADKLGCTAAGIEIKIQEDQRLTGPRYAMSTQVPFYIF
ncbi:hypothetical protein Y032_0010g873 [Ancylostoma ceylanicum]|uniref:Peptidase M12A domain-containing protein n=2 Tax=Ancylostoma ceylanicum TaxID=53326 RepID=A0A016VHZ6_9BILA|nr:hypothetical protein Y032_0010g873 [Ancylostoma ceylanicum]